MDDLVFNPIQFHVLQYRHSNRTLVKFLLALYNLAAIVLIVISPEILALSRRTNKSTSREIMLRRVINVEEGYEDEGCILIKLVINEHDLESVW
jgi:hypothetical protein